MYYRSHTLFRMMYYRSRTYVLLVLPTSLQMFYGVDQEHQANGEQAHGKDVKQLGQDVFHVHVLLLHCVEDE